MDMRSAVPRRRDAVPPAGTVGRVRRYFHLSVGPPSHLSRGYHLMEEWTMSEHVLVTPRQTLNEMLNGEPISGYRRCSGEQLDHLLRHAHFHPRDAAERDPTLKQLIPYVLVFANNGLLNYIRAPRVQEERLAGMRSVGVGGHVNPEDVGLEASPDGVLDPDWSGCTREVFETGMMRELHEELDGLGPDDLTGLRLVGLLNTDDTEVGAVHLGVVYLLRLRHMEISSREPDQLHDLGFHLIGHLHDKCYDELEPWSQIAVTTILAGGLT